MTYFDTVIGQDTIKKHLTDLVDRQTLPHSLLFYGEAGLGKLAMAIGLASLLVGRQVFGGGNGERYLAEVEAARLANGESQKKIEAEGLPLYMDKGDVFWLRPMKSTLKVEQWYTLLQDHLSVVGLGNRVVIVEDFHTANLIMANAMLKTIEEPPEKVYFIILTDKINTVLPTIVSRCMGVSFQPVGPDILRQAFSNRSVEEGDLEDAIALGQGNPAIVESLLSQGTIHMLDLAVRWMSILGTSRQWFGDIALLSEKLSREEALELMHWLRLVARDMMALKSGATIEQLQLPMHRRTLLKLISHWSMLGLSAVTAETLKAERALRLHIKIALVVDGLSIALHDAREEV
ncbi:ATP-binding protein [Veillonella agrestimuris]|uniref:DNA polymerase III subunit n=1 Tax=Veillonella agrestimuris TaxID=2941340 RepID=UPI0020406811|nr:DNA polymerase III subunit delta' C-terminal domain-containing protein [Veillonella agrestimuris]